MLNALESGLIVLTCVASSFLILWQLRRIWPPATRKEHNDLIGWQIGFLATSYAVIVAFMLSGVWSEYQEAESNVEVEANALITLYHLTSGLPATSTIRLQSFVRGYADVVITQEWPAMNKGLPAENGAALIRNMWTVVTQIQPQTSGQQVMLDHTLTELTSLAEHHRIRQYQSRAQLPAVFWLVLIVGGFTTIAYTCLLGVESRRIHVLQVGTTTLVISLVLIAIADADQPFRGAIHVSSAPFHAALNVFNSAP